MQALLRDDAQAVFLEAGVDLAGEVAAGGVGLEDGERALGRHGGKSLGLVSRRGLKQPFPASKPARRHRRRRSFAAAPRAGKPGVMSLLVLSGVTIRIAGRTLLDGADLTVDPGRRIGLVGPQRRRQIHAAEGDQRRARASTAAKSVSPPARA